MTNMLKTLCGGSIPGSHSFTGQAGAPTVAAPGQLVISAPTKDRPDMK